MSDRSRDALLNVDKSDRSRDALLKTRGLNLGSGPHYAEGWVNVDKYAPPEGCREPDLRADVFHLEDYFPEASFQAAYLGHFLEHLRWDRIPLALAQVRHVCAPGASVMAVGPCLYRAIRTSQPQWLIEAIVADPRQKPTGHGHAWTPTEELTRVALEEGGLTNVTTVPIVGVTKPAWPNPSTAPWQTAAMGIVP